MKHQRHRDFSKLQLVCSLFADSIGDDLYFARQIKESIEAALPAEERNDAEAFIRSSQRLVAQMATAPGKSGVGIAPAAREQGFSMLALRNELLSALKETCRFERPLVVLTGLKEAICPTGRRWTARRKQEYEEAVDFARDFCHQRSRPSSKLTLVIF